MQKLVLGTDPLSLHFLECTKLVLPNLTMVIWAPRYAVTGTNRISFSSLRTLFTPKLDTLEFLLNDVTDPTFPSLLGALTFLCPNLKSINFDLRGQPPLGTTEALAQLICSNADWNSVALSQHTDNVTLRSLGLSSTLKAVSLIFDPETIQPDFEHTGTPFRNVTRLTLFLRNRLDVAMHLLRPRDQAFRAFKVSLERTRVTSTDLFALLLAIVSPPRIHSLQSLIVLHYCPSSYTIDDDSVPAHEIRGFPYEAFRPIASLVYLHELVVNLDYPIIIDDDEFAHLVCNWPYLEVLCLSGGCKTFTNAMGLKGLLSLLGSCPRLREIKLSLDVRQVPSDAGVHRPLVTHLTFVDSPILDPILVEAFLFRHLPRVRFVEPCFTIWTSVSEQYLESWKLVNSYMCNRSQGE